jgi:hypothetical protein
MENRAVTHRVITFLTRDELDFLDKLEKDIIFSSGMHISRSKIIEDLADILTKTKMDAIGIKNDDELKARMLEAITKVCAELKDHKTNP